MALSWSSPVIKLKSLILIQNSGNEPRNQNIGTGQEHRRSRNERVIVVSRGLSEPQSQCEFYYADQRQWKKLIDGPKVARAHGQLTELHDGRVLASGGALFGKSPTELAPHASCELFDPKTFVWTEVEPMNHPRFAPSGGCFTRWFNSRCRWTNHEYRALAS